MTVTPNEQAWLDQVAEVAALGPEGELEVMRLAAPVPSPFLDEGDPDDDEATDADWDQWQADLDALNPEVSP